jgi:predicted RNA-binding protein
LANYWFCVVDEDNWEIIKKKDLWGVSEGNRKRLESTQIGDLLVFYVKRHKLGGSFRVVSKPFKSREKVFIPAKLKPREVFPYRVKLRPEVIPEKPKDFLKIVPKLSFIGNKRQWKAYIQKAMQQIGENSFKTLEEELRTA